MRDSSKAGLPARIRGFGDRGKMRWGPRISRTRSERHAGLPGQGQARGLRQWTMGAGGAAFRNYPQLSCLITSGASGPAGSVQREELDWAVDWEKSCLRARAAFLIRGLHAHGRRARPLSVHSFSPARPSSARRRLLVRGSAKTVWSAQASSWCDRQIEASPLRKPHIRGMFLCLLCATDSSASIAKGLTPSV